MIRHLLGLEGMPRQELEGLLDQAAQLRQDVLEQPVKKSTGLRGRAFVNLFFEASTRTKTSFELAGKFLGADVVNFQGKGSSVEKGETLYDTAQNIAAMGADLLVVRHGTSGVPAELQRHLNIPVVNAGDGFHEHPTQGLLDMRTVLDARGQLDNLHLLIVGDILHSRVARSDLWGFLAMGAWVTLVGPPSMLPEGLATDRVRLTSDLDAVIGEADVVQVLRIQKERKAMVGMPSIEEYRLRWGITPERARRLSPHALILHPGPQNRGVEIDSSVMTDPRTCIAQQVRNGVAVRMAVLARLMGGHHDE